MSPDAAPSVVDEPTGSSGSGGGSPRAPGRPSQEVVFPTREQYVAVVEEYKDGGFEMCADLCAVDYLTHPGRRLPEGDAELPTIFELYPGVEAMEREAYDLFGILFAGHPDMTRILMPEDWEGHPLRKDYDTGHVPVQFKESPGGR